jgi:soluble lytic murein transglycosylase-like protein
MRRGVKPAVAVAGLAVTAVAAWLLLSHRPAPLPAAAKPKPHLVARVASKPVVPPPPNKAEPSVFQVEEAMGFSKRMKRWNPLIEQASKRFGVPQSWLRAVMQAESGGRTMLDETHKVVSSAGAMGLMQLMPQTYEDMRVAYGLGKDPFDPHDNVMAGAAYLRFLRGKYGYPTMFAAYNDGPGNLEERLRDGGLLPTETRLYLVNVTANVEGLKGAARGAAQFTRPNGSPILVDCSQVTKVRAALPDEYAPGVLSVITVGKVRQGVREDPVKVTAAIRARGGLI